MTESVKEIVLRQEPRFVELDRANGLLLDFKAECLFALQQLHKNDYAMQVAEKNPNSLQAAILNVAAIGISLNPAQAHAYLVPRDERICLDISFRGFVKLATDCGAVKWAKAELVYKNDSFIYNGPNEKPTHQANIFGDRGELIGGYCIAKLPDGEVLIDTMPVAEIHKVREVSKAYQKGKGPWVDWYEEMCKKTLVKRAYKSWPQSSGRERLDKAVEVVNEHEGTAFTLEQQSEYLELIHSERALDLFLFQKRVGEDVYVALGNAHRASIPRGEKQKGAAVVNELYSKGCNLFQEASANLQACAESQDDAGCMEILSEFDGPAQELLIESIPAELQHFAGKAAKGTGTFPKEAA